MFIHQSNRGTKTLSNSPGSNYFSILLAWVLSVFPFFPFLFPSSVFLWPRGFLWYFWSSFVCCLPPQFSCLVLFLSVGQGNIQMWFVWVEASNCRWSKEKLRRKQTFRQPLSSAVLQDWWYGLQQRSKRQSGIRGKEGLREECAGKTAVRHEGDGEMSFKQKGRAGKACLLDQAGKEPAVLVLVNALGPVRAGRKDLLLGASEEGGTWGQASVPSN